MQQLYNQATRSAYRQMVTFADGTHNDTWYVGSDSNYHGRIISPI